MQEWWLACLANTVDLIIKTFPGKGEIPIITNSQLIGRIAGECIQQLMRCTSHNEYSLAVRSQTLYCSDKSNQTFS